MYLGNLTCRYFTRNRGLPAGLSSDYLRSRGDYASTTRGADLTRFTVNSDSLSLAGFAGQESIRKVVTC